MPGDSLQGGWETDSGVEEYYTSSEIDVVILSVGNNCIKTTL